MAHWCYIHLEKRLVILKVLQRLLTPNWFQFDGESTSFTDFDPNMTTDVTFLDNGIQFVITSMNKEAVLVNMYAPEFFKKIPITISQQSYAIPPGEGFEVKTQSRLEITIPNNPVQKRDTKVLYGNLKWTFWKQVGAYIFWNGFVLCQFKNRFLSVVRRNNFGKF